MKLAHPYDGSAAKSVASALKASKKRFSSVARKPKGMRWPRDFSATTRKVRPPAECWDAGSEDGERVW